ncbi:MAG: hypothetical protein ACI8TQ_003768 [Planctomycetota bacterium]|jgi:hypothetical protein
MITGLIFAMLASAEGANKLERIDFARDVRPILEESCFRCHGPHAKRIRGGLMMAGRESLLMGGDSGPAVIAGDTENSLLLRMVRYESDDFEMPPTEQLDPAKVEILERWISEGVVWPGGDAGPSDRRDIDLDEGREWWAYRPVERPEVPELKNSIRRTEAINGIDLFVGAKLEEVGLEAAPLEQERLLVRRLYIDLLGIQPSLAELEAYLQDERADKWSRLIDALLERPQYGERWGRYWLDVVRYAQTNGYERDEEKLFIWRYRDYVIDAYNADKPYDQFLLEQLAGDELEEVTEESLIATGFYSLGMWDTEPNDPEQAVFDAQDDVLRTISEGMLAVSVGCARCHDHRFDPVRQKDYFSLLAFIRNVEPFAKPKFNLKSGTHRLISSDAKTREDWLRGRRNSAQEIKLQMKKIRATRLSAYINENLDELIAARPELRDFDPTGRSVNELAKTLKVSQAMVRRDLTIADRTDYLLLDTDFEQLTDSYTGEFKWLMAVSESGTEPVSTHVLRRGMASARLESVSANFLPVMCDDDESALPSVEPNLVLEAPERSTSGQRLALAKWIADPKHPSTARVMVNRIWQGHFGEGLVRTPDDFGTQGERPSHQKLLDWLASEFVAGGWSVKSLHRLILNSATYRRSSTFESERASSVDPGNRLLWRQNMRRFDSESLRDSILAVCGELNLDSGGRGFFPALSLEAISGSSRPGGGWEKSSEAERNRRGVYTFVKRGMSDPFLATFDLPDPSFTRGRRDSTTVANQALTLLNGAFTNRVAESLAQSLIEEFGSDLPSLVRGVYERVLVREPNPAEMDIATKFIADQKHGFAAVAPRLTFRSSIPKRVELLYLRELSGDDMLSAPREAWNTYSGEWGNGYNKTLEVDPVRGPFAVLRQPKFTNGRVSFGLQFEKGCEQVSFLLRARPKGELVAAIKVVLDVGAQGIRLIQVRPGETMPLTLELIPCELIPERRYEIGLQIFNSNVIVAIDGEQKMSFDGSDLDPPIYRGTGRFGISCEGAAVHLDKLTIQADQKTTNVVPDDPGSPLKRALALFCQTAFSLNEFLYVD